MCPNATRFAMAHKYGLSTHAPCHIRIGPVAVFDKFPFAKVYFFEYWFQFFEII